MDERNLPKDVSGDAVGSIKRAQPGLGSTVVFCGDPALVQEGLEIALRAMGIGRFEHEGDPDA